MSRPFDVSAILDEARSSGYIHRLVALAALAIIVDGIDNQLLALAIPSMMREWDLPRNAFAIALASGLLGMMAGSALAGVLGDWLGRKVALVSSVAAFGLLSITVALAQGASSLAVLRFLTGLGLGGALPNAAALVSEYVPRRARPMAVTYIIVCIPVGGMIAAYGASYILPSLGWRWLFVIGGAIPLLTALALWRWLAESPHFLAQRPHRWPELVTVLRRAGHHVPAGATFDASSASSVSRPSIHAVFVSEHRRDTLALWVSFFACMLAVYAGINWIPTLLSGAGWSVANASRGILFFNLGGVAGSLVAGRVVTRFGSRWPMVGLAAFGATSAIVLANLSISGEAPVMPVLTMLTIAGALINALTVMLYALAAHVYPAAVRATGVGTVVGFGRIGAVVSASIGAWAIDLGGYPYFFGAMAAAMATCIASVLAVRRHIGGAGSNT